jgi:hypothetical protein
MAKAADKNTETLAAEMDEGRFAPIDENGVIEGEVVESTERALSLVGQSSEIDMGMVAVLTRAELDQQITTARAYPRSVTLAMNATKEIACLDMATAKECGYALPRGKDDSGKAKVVTGPSVRLAEIVAGRWGNCRAESRTVLVDRVEMFVEAEGMFHDLETNYAVRARVRRSIRGKPWQGKPGKLFSDDMINVTSNAAGSIAFRNAVFKGIPKPIWAPAYAATLDVVRGDLKSLGARRVDLLVAFKDQLQIKPETLYKILGVPGEQDIGLDELVIAAGFFSAIKNNEITAEDLIRDVGGPATAAGTKTLAGAFGDKSKTEAPKEPAKAADKPAVTPPHDPETGEVTGDDDGDSFPGDRPTSTASAPAADAGQATSGSATTATTASPAQEGSGQTDAADSSTDGDEADDHVPGSEKTDPGAFLLWAPTADNGDRKRAFTALSRTAAYKNLAGNVRDMIAAAVTGEEQQAEEAAGEAVKPGKPDPDEIYFFAGEARGEDNRRPTWKNGEPFSTSAADLTTYGEHGLPPAEAEKTATAPAEGAVGAFWKAIEGQESWLAIKAQVTVLYKSEEWGNMDAAEQRQIRIEIWEAVDALVRAKKDPLDFVTDPGAYRLWMETCNDPDAIQGNFNVLKKEPAWLKMKDDKKDSLQNTVLTRINLLRED